MNWRLPGDITTSDTYFQTNILFSALCFSFFVGGMSYHCLPSFSRVLCYERPRFLFARLPNSIMCAWHSDFFRSSLLSVFHLPSSVYFCFQFVFGFCRLSLWLNCVNPNFYCWSPHSVPQNVILFEDRGFTEVIKLKWGHYVSLNAIRLSIFVKRRSLDTEAQVEGIQCEETQGEDNNLQAKERSVGQTFCSQSSKGTILPTAWFWTCSLQNLRQYVSAI